MKIQIQKIKNNPINDTHKFFLKNNRNEYGKNEINAITITACLA